MDAGSVQARAANGRPARGNSTDAGAGHSGAAALGPSKWRRSKSGQRRNLDFAEVDLATFGLDGDGAGHELAVRGLVH